MKRSHQVRRYVVGQALFHPRRCAHAPSFGPTHLTRHPTRTFAARHHFSLLFALCSRISRENLAGEAFAFGPREICEHDVALEISSFIPARTVIQAGRLARELGVKRLPSAQENKKIRAKLRLDVNISRHRASYRPYLGSLGECQEDTPGWSKIGEDRGLDSTYNV